MPASAKGPQPKTPARSTVNLGDETKKVGLITAEGKARVVGLYADTVARVVMVLVIAGIFIGLNWAVMGFVKEVFRADLAFMNRTPPIAPADRIVDTKLLMTLIGATVVQVGVAIIAIVSYLFPKTKHPSDAERQPDAEE